MERNVKSGRWHYRVMSSSVVWYLACLLLPVGHTRPLHHKCQCVPDVWSGDVFSTEREYDLRHGQSATSRNTARINYDYVNKIFSVVDLKTGNIAVSDYRKGYKYLVRGERCHAIEFDEKMKQMCMPENAEFIREAEVKKGLVVEMLEFQAPGNVNVSTTVIQNTCMPLTEEMAITMSDYASVTTSSYLNVRYDTDVIIPDHCLYSKNTPMKRDSEEHTDLEDLLHKYRVHNHY